jgi:ABC-2 type transport system ATP-binding protein
VRNYYSEIAGGGDLMKTEALVVRDVYKKFEKPGPSFWQQMLQKRRNGKNKDLAKSNGNVPAVIETGQKLSQSSELDLNKHNGAGKNGTATADLGAANKNSRKRTIVAVDHVSFTVAEGEIFGVLGPNGSGKSTLIRLVATLLLPDDGELKVFGYDVVRQPRQVQELINRVSVEASFFKKLSPMENLLYGARLYGLPGKETRQQVVKILTRLGLEDRSIYSPMEEMSRGMQQKVAIARALLSKPRLLLLDEPTTGLDPRSKREVQAVVEELQQQGTTIVLTTHDMREAEILCDRVAIIEGGKIVALDTPEGLKSLISGRVSEPTLEDVFLELTGKKLVKEEELAA